LKTITFIRHGQSAGNAGAVTMPHADIPLTELGHQQANALAAALAVEPHHVLVSTMVRTQQTAAPLLARMGLPATINPWLDEFSMVDPSLIGGMDGAARGPFVKPFWDNPDPYRRIGTNADTFLEFNARVDTFKDSMNQLPDSTVIFGHGIWFALMLWRLLGYSVTDAKSMGAFRSFQLGLPMPNCAVFNLSNWDGVHWSVMADTVIAQRMLDELNQKATSVS
jgi:broad specificity phosphatase PhoE